jgi:hypothetical protein
VAPPQLNHLWIKYRQEENMREQAVTETGLVWTALEEAENNRCGPTRSIPTRPCIHASRSFRESKRVGAFACGPAREGWVPPMRSSLLTRGFGTTAVQGDGGGALVARGDTSSRGPPPRLRRAFNPHTTPYPAARCSTLTQPLTPLLAVRCFRMFTVARDVLSRHPLSYA